MSKSHVSKVTIAIALILLASSGCGKSNSTTSSSGLPSDGGGTPPPSGGGWPPPGGGGWPTPGGGAITPVVPVIPANTYVLLGPVNDYDSTKNSPGSLFPSRPKISTMTVTGAVGNEPNSPIIPVHPGDKITLSGEFRGGRVAGWTTATDSCDDRQFAELQVQVGIWDGRQFAVSETLTLASALSWFGEDSATVTTEGFLKFQFDPRLNCSLMKNVRIKLKHCVNSSGETVSCP